MPRPGSAGRRREVRSREWRSWPSGTSSTSTGSWTIGGQVVAVRSSTKIVGNPIVGDTVEVSASRDASGNLTATRIQLERRAGSGGDEGDGGGGGRGGRRD